jgi:hypothetical protein
MLVARVGCRFDAGREYASRFLGARFASQELTVHEIAGNISGVVFEKRAKVLVRRRSVAARHAFERQTIAREGVAGLLGDNLLEHLAARFLLSGGFVHICSLLRTSRIIRGRRKAANTAKEEDAHEKEECRERPRG